jgi:restriction system protein
MSLLLVLNPTIVGVTPLRESIAEQGAKFPLAVSSLIVPEQRTHEGILVQSTSLMWLRIVQALGKDWSVAYQIPYGKWEEIVAGAFKEAGYDEVTLTPRSGDYGRDVIARRKGVACVKVLGSVKAYKQGHLVDQDEVRALLGVLSGERDASKGILATTSDFAPRIDQDPFIAPFMPYRLELMNGPKLQEWLSNLAGRPESEP